MINRPLCLLIFVCSATPLPADEPGQVELSAETRRRCQEVLREGMAGEDFWPAIHAAEGLTLGGHGDEVIRFLAPKLEGETDDQRRCGIARELVRAGDRSQAQVMLDILAGDDGYGHVHAAESLFKVFEISDGTAMRAAFDQTGNLPLRLMAAGALARCGSPAALAFLREMVAHDDPETFKIVVWLLGRIGDEHDVPLIRGNRSRAPDELNRAYHDHSLAALGDAEGLAALGENLSSGDPAVRTYAATFAGDARAVQFQQQLEAMLDDPHPDARIRAAQSLLDLANAPPADRQEDVSVLLYEATEQNPRYTEGSVLELNDGSLLYAVTEFQGGGSDFARARIIGRRSGDGGRTWQSPRVLQENTGAQNVMSATLRRLRPPAPPGTIALFYLEKNGYDDLKLLVRFSTDEAATFSDPVLATPEPGYHVVNNDRITQLSTGRLLAPAASTADVRNENHFVSHCFLSDDSGQTWRKGKQSVDLPKRGAMEPEVIELTDGRVMMPMRNQLGHISRSFSEDGGETWSEPAPLGNLQAPEAPATVRRIPATGDLLLIWNNTYVPGAGHGGKRTPLTAALSQDEGETWKIIGNLEDDPEKTFSYVSLIFVGDRTVMSYWESAPETGRLSSRFRSLPVSWFYRQ
jgi:sialidase-1